MVFKTTTNIDGDFFQYTTLDFHIYDHFYMYSDSKCSDITYTITFAEVNKLPPRYSYFPPDFSYFVPVFPYFSLHLEIYSQHKINGEIRRSGSQTSFIHKNICAEYFWAGRLIANILANQQPTMMNIISIIY